MSIAKEAPTVSQQPHQAWAGSNGIFCNRELSMKQIKAIGFDMDYTLAQYQSSFDLLAFEGAKKKLVENLGYPEEVLTFEYDPDHFTRGLIIDKQKGNIIKMDRHKYVRVAYHGYRELTSAERKALYQNNAIVKEQGFSGPNYVNLDTLFSMVDCVLYAHLIQMLDENASNGAAPDYTQVWKDVRTCVDLCHRDGVIKDCVAEDPTQYIVPDPEMVPMLKRLKQEGIKVFLLTNSLWDYTNVVMNYLVGNPKDKRTTEWVDLFDIVIVGACKPGFLLDPFSNLFRVDTDYNKLINTDGVLSPPKEFLHQGTVFQGGNWMHLHELLELDSGEQLLYVGDHMYSDILRSKRALGWRTCLIVPELDHELETGWKHAGQGQLIDELRQLQYQLDECADELRFEIAKDPDASALARLNEELEAVTIEQDICKRTLAEENLVYHRHFHPLWGQLFKSGYQSSRFAKQVSTYACIYTARASNFLRISGNRSFRASRDLSPHDMLLEAVKPGRSLSRDMLRARFPRQQDASRASSGSDEAP
ncbi:unnamed protein product [Chrysoparadoxa australica]